jgi:hypothetical protein
MKALVSTGAVKESITIEDSSPLIKPALLTLMVVDAWAAALNVGEDIGRYFFELRFPAWYWHTESLQEKLLE